MAQKFLYLVDHFCDFPTSEYGGLWAVIAENDDECFDLIVESDNGFNQRFYVNLREKVINAQKFLLSENVHYESTIVEQFTT
jgi:hypothetical protein